VDGETGKILREIPPLWSAAGTVLQDDRLVVTTVDGLVYAMNLR